MAESSFTLVLALIGDLLPPAQSSSPSSSLPIGLISTLDIFYGDTSGPDQNEIREKYDDISFLRLLTFRYDYAEGNPPNKAKVVTAILSNFNQRHPKIDDVTIRTTGLNLNDEHQTDEDASNLGFDDNGLHKEVGASMELDARMSQPHTTLLECFDSDSGWRHHYSTTSTATFGGFSSLQ
ncbi:hypothetical protein K457DRAFT_20728 [Linnemannia elongata AG-77]|uniref:Uncharacterized protein n=1 Tax=Linnemannia elongata AG-77 TaxID=1314771 RepID=A0A197JRB2_9FUNG|nr:hypothetical protein K457DRAFT_20728 [Linnemannia elongata AG-77]